MVLFTFYWNFKGIFAGFMMVFKVVF